MFKNILTTILKRKVDLNRKDYLLPFKEVAISSTFIKEVLRPYTITSLKI
jgi:hypothetical protein